MGKRTYKLELKDVLQTDAAEIVAARTKAQIIHGSGDIDASGDEVEEAVRAVLRRKLPSVYYVGHGHILDHAWNDSPQVDIIIADNTGSPILFQAQHGMAFFPYESIYAIGEAKTTYRKAKKDIEAFSDTLSEIRQRLSRSQTPQHYTRAGFELNEHDFKIEGAEPYQNSFFSFMVFAEATDFEVEHVLDLYSRKVVLDLPNILCLFSKGVVLNVRLPVNDGGNVPAPMHINVHPEFNTEETGWVNRWVFRPAGLAETFGFLYYALINHLKSCVLMPPDMVAYLQRVFLSGDTVGIRVFD